MPRNKSEKNPVGAAFLAYAEATVDFLNSSHRDASLVSKLWEMLPHRKRSEMIFAVQGTALMPILGDPFRQACVDYIEKTYGT